MRRGLTHGRAITGARSSMNDKALNDDISIRDSGGSCEVEQGGCFMVVATIECLRRERMGVMMMKRRMSMRMRMRS
jgi:hypothetical protein